MLIKRDLFIEYCLMKFYGWKKKVLFFIFYFFILLLLFFFSFFNKLYVGVFTF
jgi:hypothetical protein